MPRCTRALALLLVCLAACDRAPATRPFGVVHVWNLPQAIAALALSRDGQSALLGSKDGESSLWTAPWQLSTPFDRGAEPLLAARFTTEDRLLFLRAHGAVEVRASSGAMIFDPHVRLHQPAKFAAASPSGRYIAYDANVYDLEVLRSMVKVEPNGDVRSVEFAGERMVLVTQASDPQLTVLRLDGRPTERHSLGAEALGGAISRDGMLRAAGGSERLTIWRSHAPQPSCTRAVNVKELRFSASGRWLAAASGERVLVLDASTCAVRASVVLGAPITALDVDEDLVAGGTSAGDVWVWDTFNAQLLANEKVFATSPARLIVHAATRSVLAAANGSSGATVKLLRVQN